MSQQIVEIEIQAEDFQLFGRLVAEYGEGDPSKFLSFAIRKIARESLRSKLVGLQQQAREDMKRTLISEEILLVLAKLAKVQFSK